jgi:hypothetical protein
MVAVVKLIPRVLLRAVTCGCVTGLAVTGASAGADSCPNASVRTGRSQALPDCRAYELVTPSFKFGANVGARAIGDGSHLELKSIGAFNSAGDDQGVEGSDYIAARAASGWSSVPVDPLASEFQNGATLGGLSPLEDVSAAFDKQLLVGIPSSSKPIDHRFYLREPNGSLVEVGPVFPPATVAAWTETFGDRPGVHYEGGSAALSHVLFHITAGTGTTHFLWPGDTTIQNASLYEYVGTGNAPPRLVGLDNSGQLISQCGTQFGSAESSGGGDAYNAISRDGETIFFTADPGGCFRRGVAGYGPPAQELYARIGGTRTVAISEPNLPPGTQCTVGHGCFGAPPADGVLQGASQDGRRAFFLTEQPLVDGDEDTGKDLYMAEIEGSGASAKLGKLVQVSHDENPGEAAEVQGVARVSMDGSRAYFVALGVLTRTPNELGQLPVKGANNLYVYEPDPARPGQTRIAFVADVSQNDREDWQATDTRPVEATPDGRFLLFPSTNNLTPDCPPVECPGQQLYRYDAQAGDLVRISIGEAGFNQNGTKADFSITTLLAYGSQGLAAPAVQSMSDDGSYVFFTSPAALTPQAINDPTDRLLNVYEYHHGHVYLISDGQDRHLFFGISTVSLIGASASGSDVYFTTADPLVSHDTDTQVDIYDARIGGGFPAAAPPTECQGDACQGTLGGVPQLQSPGSLSFTGPGNATPPPPVTSSPASRLASALRACRRAPRHKRRRCEAMARRRFAKRASTRRHGRSGH